MCIRDRQKEGYKVRDRNQRTENYHFYQLPRQLMRMYTPDGKLNHRFNPTIIKIRQELNDRKEERLNMRKNGPVPISSFHQAEIPNYEPDKSIDEKKMNALEAQQVHKAFECKKRKRDEMETPTRRPACNNQTTLTKEQMDEVKEVAKKLESGDFRQAIREYFKEGSANKPIDLT